MGRVLIPAIYTEFMTESFADVEPRSVKLEEPEPYGNLLEEARLLCSWN